MNMMELQRLSVDEKLLNAYSTVKTEYKAPRDTFNNLIVNLATTHPLWNFVVTDVRSYDKTIRKVTVYQHGEDLGYIEWEYFRGDYGFEVGNDRIDKARERARAYKTHDEKKALAAVRKNFTPKNISERVVEAEQQARKLLNDQSYQKRREYQSQTHTVEKHAVEFVKSIWSQYEAYMEAQGNAHILEKWREAEVEMKTLGDLAEAFGKDRSALVVKTDGGYIVKTGDKIEMMDDTTLPHHVRVKLGMLKLVEDEHFIAGIGGKVKTDVFVLTPEEGEEK